ncbi:uncharacterized protein MONBRDRAFT_12034 [Monosiga brevicollis MX1]|uniref:Uncharacterized protein n=1 Tax=Monosiga brevicollis TaxID=81824 RepID=A9VB10_MONBE|nr:uncharacterized protein MONBRDRAFT_12034 [Monosiga brevicollis MX1]EDQ85257.1 predicted protein [Monosiga brevicollis MX1]|eukprot:XP_001749878.1 hypothetical protein [Monosiga brevicollis MX1]
MSHSASLSAMPCTPAAKEAPLLNHPSTSTEESAPRLLASPSSQLSGASPPVALTPQLPPQRQVPAPTCSAGWCTPTEENQSSLDANPQLRSSDLAAGAFETEQAFLNDLEHGNEDLENMLVEYVLEVESLVRTLADGGMSQELVDYHQSCLDQALEVLFPDEDDEDDEDDEADQDDFVETDEEDDVFDSDNSFSDDDGELDDAPSLARHAAQRRHLEDAATDDQLHAAKRSCRF